MKNASLFLILSLFTVLISCKTSSDAAKNQPIEPTVKNREFKIPTDAHPQRENILPTEVDDQIELPEQRKPSAVKQNSVNQTSVIVYKTKGNYANLVPVRLSDDKSEIVSYPAPSDLIRNGSLVKQTELISSYLIDNIGIGKNTVFLKLTIEEYASMKNQMLLSDLFNLIIDKDPFLEMYNCGSKNSYSNLKNELIDQINNGELKTKNKNLLK